MIIQLVLEVFKSDLLGTNMKISSSILVLLSIIEFILKPSTTQSLAFYISTRNHTKFVLQFGKRSLTNRKWPKHENSSYPRNFWHLARNIFNNFTFSSFSPLFHLMALLSLHLSLNLNFSLRLLLGWFWVCSSLPTSLWLFYAFS